MADHIGPLTILGKNDPRTGQRVRQFEAADYIAWELRNAVEKLIFRDTQPYRQSARRILGDISCDINVLNGRSLLQYCQQMGLRPRKARGR